MAMALLVCILIGLANTSDARKVQATLGHSQGDIASTHSVMESALPHLRSTVRISDPLKALAFILLPSKNLNLNLNLAAGWQSMGYSHSSVTGTGRVDHVVRRPLLASRASSSQTVLRTSSAQMQPGEPDQSIVETCKAKIAAAIDVKELQIQGAYDDPNGSHISIYCVSEAFEGKRSLARQQMIYKAIWEEMQGDAAPLHAVDKMELKAPSEV